MYDIMRCYSGSLAYGTNLPSSDVDIRGLFCAEQKFIRTPFYNIKEQTLVEEEDGKIYELTNFMNLFAEMNPNIIELMFVDEKDILSSSKTYEYLRHMAPELLTKKVAFSFSGYAMSQLKRIKGHDKWINNPQPEKAPTQFDFFRMVHNYTEQKIMNMEEFQYAINGLNAMSILIPYGHDVYGVVVSWNSPGLFNPDGSIRKLEYSRISDEDKKRTPVMIVKYLADEHKRAKEKHKNYWTWKENRNPARHELEVNFGYDCYLDETTEFLTENGFKKYDDIVETDKLATVNPLSKVVEFQHYFDRVKKPYTGEVYTLETRDTCCEVTGNHRMFTAKRSRKNDSFGEFGFSPFTELPMEFVQLRTTNPSTEDLCGFSDTDIIIVGAYASEGSLLKCGKGGIKGVSISQLAGGRLCKFIDPLVKDGTLRLSQHLRKGRYENTYNLYSKDYGECLKDWCGEYSVGKRLPWWITELSSERAKLMLEVLISGDGSERPHSYIYHTSSPTLADDVQVLATMAGMTSKVWDYKEKHGMYQVYISKNTVVTENVYTRNHKKSRHVENKDVVCFSVPNETLVTRNKGKLSFHGNTKHAMHLVRLMRMAKEILTTGEVHVKRADAQELLGIRGGKWTLEELLEWAEYMDAEIQGPLYKQSQLRHSADRELFADVLMQAQDMCWHG